MKLKLLLIVSFFALTVSGRAEQIAWSSDFETAEKIARESGKPLMLDFTAEWCSVCREMDRVFWTRSNVVELSKDFVSVKIDGEKFPLLADKFGVRGYPTVVFADAWNAGRDNYMGFGQGGDRVIIEKAKQFPKNFGEFRKAGKSLEKSKSKAQDLMEFAEFYRANKLYILSIRIYRDVLKLESKAEIKEIALLNSANDYLKLGQPAESLKLFEQLQKDFPKSARTDEFLYGIFYAHLRTNNLPQAEADLARLKTNFPGSKIIQKAEELFGKAKKN